LVDKVLFSSKSTEWETPAELFSELHREFWFDLDVCATADNAKCAKFYNESDNGLIKDWHMDGKVCWMNPPYGREIGAWIEKAWSESLRGCRVVCLLPVRTDTKYFHQFIWDMHNNRPKRGVDIRFLRGRIKFVDAKSSAPFPSMVVIFSPGVI